MNFVAHAVPLRCLYLPRHLGTATDSESKDITPPSDRGNGESVLVVDDEPTVRLLIPDVLVASGYIPLESPDGSTALKLLQSNMRIDLLVTDVGPPNGMNGRHLADAARVSRPDLKVVFITRYAENAVVGSGRLAPGNARADEAD